MIQNTIIEFKILFYFSKKENKRYILMYNLFFLNSHTPKKDQILLAKHHHIYEEKGINRKSLP